MTKPRVEDVYPFPLVPKKGHLGRADLEKAFLVKPMEKLPNFLVPSTGKKYKMTHPKFHYGWAFDDRDFLLELAKRKGVPPRPRAPVELPKKGDDEYDSDMDYEDLPPSSFSMTDYWLKQDVLRVIAKELKLHRPIYLAEVYNVEKGRVYMVSVMESIMMGKNRPSRNDIQKLKDYFNFQEGPMWYLDCYHWTWGVDRKY